MVSGNTETRIGVTYDDNAGKLNFEVDDQSGSGQTYELKSSLVSSNVKLLLDASGAGTDDEVLITAGANISFSQVGEGGFTIAASSGTATISDGDYGDITVSLSLIHI